ncbi:MAG: ribose-phosphate pyrophosphokinase [Candidatus Firestonebacteria bacterium]
MVKNNRLKVFTGSANPDLAKKICNYLGIKLGDLEISKFPDGETWIKINENVRGADCFLIQSTSSPVNEHVVELLIMIDAFKRASAKRITVVIPYYSYARQDRKDQPRVAISAKLIADLLSSAGANRVLTMDLHAPQVQGFFNIPVDHLIAEPVLVKYFEKKKISNLVVTASDMGGVKMVRSFAQRLSAPVAIVDKRRLGPHHVEAMTLIGEVFGKNVLIPDDIISTGGTIVEAVNFLKERGAKDIYVCCTHPVLCGEAIEKLNKAPIKEIVVTDTIAVTDKVRETNKISVISVDYVFGEAIKSIHNETSVSRLFK